MDVEDHGAAGVGVVGDVHAPAGQLVDEPGVDSAEEELACLGASARAGDVVQQPLDLGAGEVGVGHEAGLFADHVAAAVGHQLVDDVGGAAALPDDGVGDGLAGLLVPDDRGLALVCDADGGDVDRLDAELFHGGVRDLVGGIPNLVRVMLDPAGMREDLAEFLVDHGADIAGFIEQDAAGARRPLIQRHYIFHFISPFNCIKSKPSEAGSI